MFVEEILLESVIKKMTDFEVSSAMFGKDVAEEIFDLSIVEEMMLKLN